MHLPPAQWLPQTMTEFSETNIQIFPLGILLMPARALS
jgi:hypothetical protein